MKTTFSRQFALIAALLLVCMLFTGVSFRFLMLRYLKNDKKETLSADAQAVASLAEAYDSTGELEENWDFRLSLSLFSDVGEAEAQVCDENGFVVLCSCDEFNCEHLGRQIDADLITEIDMNGETFRVGTLTGIHDGRRYIAGRPIVSDDTEQTIGYVIISSDMSQITDFMQRSSSLFFYSAIIVLVLSMAAATFLSHQQVQPLNKVAEAARRFGRGELDTRVEVPKSCGEEIVDLANAFNTMVPFYANVERTPEYLANTTGTVSTDNFYWTSRLIAAGRRQIVYLYTSTSYSGMNKLKGYKNALSDAGIPLREEWTHLCTKNIQRAKDYLNTLYDKGISFDAVVTSDDSLAVGAVKYAYEHRIAIPEQLQIIGYNNSVLANCTEPELTSIDSKVEQLSVKAVNILMQVLSGHDVPAENIIAADIIKRNTTNF